MKQLARSPLALIVALMIIVLPCAFAWYSVSASWNPYTHTDGLKVAVVNKDEGVNVSSIRVDGIDTSTLPEKLGGSSVLNIGSMMVEAMEEDNSFDWEFVDASQGESGLESGEYYAEFVIPDHFTRDVLDVLGGNLEKPAVEYWVNEKHSAVALEVAEGGSDALDAVISRSFTAMTADAMTSVLKSVAANLMASGNVGNSSVKTGLDGASNDLKMVTNSLTHSGETIDGWREEVSTTKKSIDDLKKKAPELREALDEGKKLLAEARAGANEVNSAYSSALAGGGDELAKALDRASGKISKAASDIEGEQKAIDTALEKATTSLAECDRLIAALRKVDPTSSTLADLEKESEKLQDEIADLEKASQAVSEAAGKADEAATSLKEDIDKTSGSLKGRSDEFNDDIMPKLETSLDSLALVMGALDGVLGGLDGQIDQAKALLDQLDSVFQRTKESLETTSGLLDGVKESLISARSDLAALANSEMVRKATGPTEADMKSYGAFMASPIKTEVGQLYSPSSYGAGVAPFYANLALWIGCILLVMIMKLEVDPERYPGVSSWQGYAGRLMLFGFFALLQGVVVTVGDLILGIQPFGPVSFVLAGIFTAFCFISIVFALSITFKHVGKALAIILLIVQVPAASGMYPADLMADLFQGLQAWLPFTYGMGAMREAVGGFYDGAYLRCLAWLFACGVITLVLAMLVRPRALNLNRLFDRKFEEGDLFIIEEGAANPDVVADPAIAADSQEADNAIEVGVGPVQVRERAERFAHRYRFVKQVAPIVIVALLACLCISSSLLGFGANGKLVALSAFTAIVAAIFCLCVAYEFVGYKLDGHLARLAEGPAGPAGGMVRPQSHFRTPPMSPRAGSTSGAFAGTGEYLGLDEYRDENMDERTGEDEREDGDIGARSDEYADEGVDARVVADVDEGERVATYGDADAGEDERVAAYIDADEDELMTAYVNADEDEGYSPFAEVVWGDGEDNFDRASDAVSPIEIVDEEGADA